MTRKLRVAHPLRVAPDQWTGKYYTRSIMIAIP